MKIITHTLIPLLLIFSLRLSAQSESPYHFILPEPQSLAYIIEKISSQYDLTFSYSEDLAQKEILGPLTIEAETLADFLDNLFQNGAISYLLLDNNQVLIRKKEHYQQKNASLPSINISGKIVDAETGEPIYYAIIKLDTLPIGTFSDPNGEFRLSIPTSEINGTVYIHMLGYQREAIPVQSCLTEQRIAIKPHPFTIHTVAIEEKNPLLVSSPSDLSLQIRSFSATSASTLGQSDILRSIQLLPGIQANNDLNAGIQIRGSANNETLIILDGIPIYKAEHFFGIYSSISSDYVEQAKLYKNALPVDYGGKTGGMLLLQSPDSILDWKSELSINTLTASMQVQSPINEKMGFIFQGRSSYGNAAESKLFSWIGENERSDLGEFVSNSRPDLIENTPRLNFYDLNAKLIIQPSQGHHISINGFRSRDNYTNEYERTYRTAIRSRPVLNQEAFRQHENWANTGVSVNYSYTINPKLRLYSNLFYAQYEDETEIGSSFNRSFLNNSQNLSFNNVQHTYTENLGGILKMEYLMPNNDRISIGTAGTAHDNSFIFLTDERNIFSNTANAIEWSSFGEYSWKPNTKWMVNTGLRVSYYSLTEELYYSPRLNLTFRPLPSLILKSSLSRDNQFVRELVHENRLGQSINFLALADGREFKVGSANKYMIGSSFSKGNWLLDIELYAKYQENVMEHALERTGFDLSSETPANDTYRLYTGSGETTGLDILISHTAKRYSGWIAYTLSKSSQSFEEIFRGADFPTQNDRRHQLNWVNQYTWRNFDFNANLIYASGRPYSDFSILRSSQTRERRNLSPESRISRLPSYQRIDLGVNYHIPLHKNKISFGFSVYNLANRENVEYLQYIYAIPANFPRANSEITQIIGTETELLDRTFNLSIKWQWNSF